MSHVHDEVCLTKTYIYLQKESKFRNSKLTITCFTSKIKYFALFKVGEVKISCLLSFIYPFGYEGSLYNFDGEAVNSLKVCIFLHSKISKAKQFTSTEYTHNSPKGSVIIYDMIIYQNLV